MENSENGTMILEAIIAPLYPITPGHPPDPMPRLPDVAISFTGIPTMVPGWVIYDPMNN
jgi:hypothetical protein